MSTKIQQYLHRPNQTELGLTGTHETYLSVSTSLDLSSMFPSGEQQNVIDVSKNKVYSIMSVIDREFRINQMGEFYRDKKVRPGDEIILQKIIKSSGSSLFIDVNHFDRILFFKKKQGYSIANIDLISPLSPNNPVHDIPVIWNKKRGNLRIQFVESSKKRKDSPEMTDFYKLSFDDIDITQKDLMLTLDLNNNKLSLFSKFEFHEINWED